MDSFGVLGLGFDATETDVKTKPQDDPDITGMNQDQDQATAHFQLSFEHGDLVSEISFVNFVFVRVPNY